MPIFSMQVQADTGAVANTFATLLGLKFANTTGHRGRLRKLTIAGGGGAAQDLQVQCRLTKSDNTADGTSTDVIAGLLKVDPLSVASNVAAAGAEFTVEPTTKETDYYGLGGLNSRATLQHDWTNDPAGAPQWGKNQTLLLEGAPGAATATTLVIGIEWEEF